MLTLTDSTFSAHVTPVAATSVVCVTGAHCPHCRTFAPIFERAAAAHPEMTFFRLSAEEGRGVCRTLGIRSIPTTLLFSGERLVASRRGALTTTELETFLKAPV